MKCMFVSGTQADLPGSEELGECVWRLRDMASPGAERCRDEGERALMAK